MLAELSEKIEHKSMKGYDMVTLYHVKRMNRLSKIIAAVLCFTLVFSLLSGCKKNPDSDSSSSYQSKKSESSQKDDESNKSEPDSDKDSKNEPTSNPQTGNQSGSKNQTVSVQINKKLNPLTSDGDTVLLENPDRGFRTEIVWNVKDAVDSGDSTAYIYRLMDVYLNSLPDPCKLMLAYVYITDYRNTEISPDGIKAIEAFFELCRTKKVKLMLRFSYCDSFENLSSGANEQTIMRHIKQLAPIIKKNSDAIHTISCGFVGAYGEWAIPYQQPSVDYKKVIEAIVKNFSVPNNLFFSIRLPQYKNLLPKSSPYLKYISHNNDAMFGEQTKTGWESEHYQLGSAEWKQVINEGAYTPQDGEMFTNQNLCQTNRKPSGMEIILETAHHRHTSMSFWHGNHDVGGRSEAVMSSWKKETITPGMLSDNKIVYCPSWFKDKSGKSINRNAYDFIRDHLGYKVEGQNIKITGKSIPNSTVNISMTLKNYGMSAAFNLQSGFAILDDSYEVVSSCSVGNPSQWYSHSPSNYQDTYVPTYTLNGNIKLPSKSGKYYVAFYLKNSMNDFAKLSNDLEIAGGYNILHSFSY